METTLRFSAMWSDGLESAIKERSNEPYPITFGMQGEDFRSVRDAVNVGIDSHLEAVRFTQDGNKFTFEPETLHILVRRLLESDNENSQSLAAGICETLEIELV